MAQSIEAGRQAWCSSWKFTSQSMGRRKRVKLGLAWAFQTSKPTLSYIPPPKKATPPNPSLTVLLIGDQACKCMSLWKPLSFQPPWSKIGVHACHCVQVEAEGSFQELVLFLLCGFYGSNSNHQAQVIWQQATLPCGHPTGSSVAFSTCGILWDPECFRFQRILRFFILRIAVQALYYISHKMYTSILWYLPFKTEYTHPG